MHATLVALFPNTLSLDETLATNIKLQAGTVITFFSLRTTALLCCNFESIDTCSTMHRKSAKMYPSANTQQALYVAQTHLISHIKI